MTAEQVDREFQSLSDKGWFCTLYRARAGGWTCMTSCSVGALLPNIPRPIVSGDTLEEVVNNVKAAVAEMERMYAKKT